MKMDCKYPNFKCRHQETSVLYHADRLVKMEVRCRFARKNDVDYCQVDRVLSALNSGVGAVPASLRCRCIMADINSSKVDRKEGGNEE